MKVKRSAVVMAGSGMKRGARDGFVSQLEQDARQQLLVYYFRWPLNSAISAVKCGQPSQIRWRCLRPEFVFQYEANSPKQ